MATTTQRRRSARVAGALGNLAMLALLLLAVAYVVPSVLGYQRYVITGGSMTGTYDKGSVVFEKVVPVRDVKVGDVITYVPPASSGVTNLVTHRVVSAEPGVDGTVYRTRGDANPSTDPWTFTLDSDSQPVVAYHVPYVGWALLYLADPHHRMLLVGVPAGLIALLSIREAFRNARTGEEGAGRRADGRHRTGAAASRRVAAGAALAHGVAPR
ncbi:signal peptidase I [Intrasporangium flavum]|uniref:signal peptidase I n=1 Tax=Intrasporangium flavum TaxID=1428657 RepID=UPI00096C5BBC|nr:signal peptidase I [Intrasporangium flavum]